MQRKAEQKKLEKMKQKFEEENAAAQKKKEGELAALEEKVNALKAEAKKREEEIGEFFNVVLGCCYTCVWSSLLCCRWTTAK